MYTYIASSGSLLARGYPLLGTTYIKFQKPEYKGIFSFLCQKLFMSTGTLDKMFRLALFIVF